MKVEGQGRLVAGQGRLVAGQANRAALGCDLRIDPALLTESFAIAPDGSHIVVSEMEITRKLLVEGVAGRGSTPFGAR